MNVIRGQLSPADILLRCLHDNPGFLPEPGAAWPAVFALAAEHRVSALLCDRLLRPPGITADAGEKASWTALSRQLTFRGLGLRRDFTEAMACLAEAGVAAVALKGAHLAHNVYPRAGLREMNDLDLMVAPPDLVRAVAALNAFGYQFSKPFSQDHRHEGGHHHVPRMLKTEAAPIELHTALIRPGGALSIDTGGLWQRALPLAPGSMHFTLSPEDLLLHICIHSAYLHAAEFGLRPLCDVQQIVARHPELDWGVVRQRALEWKAVRGVFVTLHLAVDCVGAAVPAKTLDELRPPDFTTELAEVLRAHVFTFKPLSLSVSVQATRTLDHRNTGERLMHFFRNVFVSRARLAEQFPDSANSAFPAWHYFKRALVLVRRYAWLPFAALRDRDPDLLAMIERRHAITRWLEGPSRS